MFLESSLHLGWRKALLFRSILAHWELASAKEET